MGSFQYASKLMNLFIDIDQFMIACDVKTADLTAAVLAVLAVAAVCCSCSS